MDPSDDRGLAPVISGIPLECKHCGCNRFGHRSSQLNTPILTLFDLDWLNDSAEVYVCRSCGYLHWFLEPSDRNAVPAQEPPADDTSTASECVRCGSAIPPGTNSCPACGWSYRSEQE